MRNAEGADNRAGDEAVGGGDHGDDGAGIELGLDQRPRLGRHDRTDAGVHEFPVPGVELGAAVAGQRLQLEVEEFEDVEGARLVLIVKNLVAGFVDFLVEYAFGNQELGPLEVGVAGEQGVVQVEEYEIHGGCGSEGRVALQDFPQQRQGDGALAFERGGVKGVEGAQQAGEVAPTVTQQVLNDFRFEAKAAGGRLSLKDGLAVGVGERFDLEDQALADAGAQVFAQGQMQRRRAAAGDQRHPLGAGGIEGAEKGDLGFGAEGLDVVDGEQQAGCLGQTVDDVGGLQIAGRPAGLGGGGDDAAQQVAAPAAGISPQEKMLGYVGDRDGFVKGCEEIGVGGGNEVFQQGRRVGAQIESELLHAVVLRAHPAGAGRRHFG